MNRRLIATLVGAPALLAATAALAAPERIRGTIEKASAGTLVIQERDGGTITVGTDPSTKYASVVPSSLGAIRKSDFIGTATKGSGDFMVALEVVIFPNSMRGTGEGQYPWDQLSDSTRRQAAGSTTASTMTNGSITATAPTGASRVSTEMTNGTVSAGHKSSAGRTITVDYGGGKSSSIIVPPTAVVVRFVPATATIAAPGGKVFVVANGAGATPTAKFVAVGKGVTPPM